MNRLFIGATAQHDGKTTTSLGLFQQFSQMGKSVGFIKPIGQQYVISEGQQVDEDAILVKEYLSPDTSAADMSPISIPKGFTEEYIYNPKRAKIYDEIDSAIMKIDAHKDITIIEGTGHAGVGSVVDASNAVVAKLLGSKAVIVSGGGIGKCIDRIALNIALFQQEEVEVVGVIVNKVLAHKYDKINKVVRQGLKNLDVECLGVIPFTEKLTYPSIIQYIEDLNLDYLNNDDSLLHNRIRSRVLAGVIPEVTVDKISKKEDVLLVIPDNFTDQIIEETFFSLAQNNIYRNVKGIVYSGDYNSKDRFIKKAQELEIPLLSSSKDSCTLIGELQKLIVKIGVHDKDKVEETHNLISKYVDVDKVWEKLQI